MSKNSHFKKGSGSYICSSCGKRTRATGSGEEDLDLCARCLEVAEYVNAVHDRKMPIEDVPAEYRADVQARL